MRNVRNQTIYVYTTASAKLKNIYKIGMTSGNAEPRIKQQDVTSTWEQLNLLDSWSSAGKTDKEFHRFLLAKGYAEAREDASREWFIVSGGLEEIKSLWNSFTKGINRPNSFGLRPEQDSCVKKAYDYLTHYPGHPFLIDAKMRFGKTFTSYKLAETLLNKKDASNILIVTYKPSVAESWRCDLQNHVDFAGWGWRHIGHPEHDMAAVVGKPTVTFVSMQMLIHGFEAESDELDERDVNYDDIETSASKQNKTDIIYTTHFNLLIVDEVHYGTQTKNAKLIFESINKSHTVYLSGTPFKRIASGEFDDTNTFIWSYSDEQDAKRNDQTSAKPTGVYDDLPKLTRILPDLKKAAGLSGLLAQYSDEEGFAIEKMFGVDKTTGLFSDQPTVMNFLNTIAKNGTSRGFSPWGMKTIDVKMLDHSLWFLPSISAISALAKLLRSHNQWFDRFDVVETSGPTKNVAGVRDLQDRLTRNHKNGKQTIILACERFKEGITLPQLGAVFFLNGWSSPESYYQAMFRCQSPWIIKADLVTGRVLERKNDCYVFDFNPSRCLRLSYEYAEIESMKTEYSVEESLRRFHDNCPVLDNTGNRLKTDLDQTLTFGCAKSPAERIASSFWIGKTGLTNLVLALANVKESESSPLLQEITNEIKKGKIYLLPKKAGGESNMNSPAEEVEKQNNLDALIKKVQSVLKRLPTVLFVEHEKEMTSCKQIVDFADNEIFKETTGVNLSILKLMIDNHIVSDYHDRCLLRYSHELRQS